MSQVLCAVGTLYCVLESMAVPTLAPLIYTVYTGYELGSCPSLSKAAGQLRLSFPLYRTGHV